MKDVFCINFASPPGQSFYDLYVDLRSLYSIKLTHYGVTTVDGKIFTGRLGPKGTQLVQSKSMNYNDNEEIELYDVVENKPRNHIFDMSNAFSYNRFDDGFQFVFIVDEQRADDINLELLLSLFMSEDIINSYCFKYRRELSPRFLFYGIFVDAVNSNIRRTPAENMLILTINERKWQGSRLPMPQLFPKMYVRVKDVTCLKSICKKLGYTVTDCGAGMIIDITKVNGCSVALIDKDNELLKYLEEEKIVITKDKNEFKEEIEFLGSY